MATAFTGMLEGQSSTRDGPIIAASAEQAAW
jgi:hypothetical protein